MAKLGYFFVKIANFFTLRAKSLNVYDVIIAQFGVNFSENGSFREFDIVLKPKWPRPNFLK